MRILELEFESRELAQQALRDAIRMQDEGDLIVHDAALLDGEEIVASMNPAAFAAAVPSALIGAIVGTLLAGPVGLLIGGIVGGGSGAVTAKLVDTGLPQHIIDRLRRHRRGRYAVALLVSEQHTGSAASLAARAGTLCCSTLTAS